MSQPALPLAKLQEALQVALKAANQAADLMNECFDVRDEEIAASIEADKKNGGTKVEQNSSANVEIALTKSSGVDLVTEYDQRCEEIVLKTLREYSPDWKVVSEESHSDAPLTDEPTWIVDPIDGTTGFVHRSFDCCVSVGLAVNKQPVLGVVVIPRMDEIFTSIVGQGAFKNNKPVKASGITQMGKAVVCTHSPYCRHPEVINALCQMNTELLCKHQVHAVRSYGSAAMDICSVACGRLDLYYEVGPHSWDMCAAAVILREAGGVIHGVAQENLDEDNNSKKLDLKGRGYCAAATTDLSRVGVELNLKYRYGELLLSHEKKQ